jgi:hypothetical protein
MTDLQNTVSYYRNRNTKHKMPSLFESTITSPINSTDGHEERKEQPRPTQDLSYQPLFIQQMRYKEPVAKIDPNYLYPDAKARQKFDSEASSAKNSHEF